MKSPAAQLSVSTQENGPEKGACRRHFSAIERLIWRDDAPEQRHSGLRNASAKLVKSWGTSLSVLLKLPRSNLSLATVSKTFLKVKNFAILSIASRELGMASSTSRLTMTRTIV